MDFSMFAMADLSFRLKVQSGRTQAMCQPMID
jgi:hypothetical protein